MPTETRRPAWHVNVPSQRNQKQIQMRRVMWSMVLLLQPTDLDRKLTRLNS